MGWLGTIGLVVLGVATWGIFGLAVQPAVEQPIEFPHKTHVKLNLACTSCHTRAERDTVAGRPPTVLCVACHSDPDAPGERKKIPAFAERGGEIPWKRVWRLPSHVFFPHQVHVVAARVKCQTCHGPMETLERPPPRPLKRLTMEDCIRCHESSRAEPTATRGPGTATAARSPSTDCNACHR